MSRRRWLHGDKFTVGDAPARRQLAIGLEMQPITISDENLSRLADREAVAQTVRDGHEVSTDFNKNARRLLEDKLLPVFALVGVSSPSGGE
jgi:hypothetical protein